MAQITIERTAKNISTPQEQSPRAVLTWLRAHKESIVQPLVHVVMLGSLATSQYVGNTLNFDDIMYKAGGVYSEVEAIACSVVTGDNCLPTGNPFDKIAKVTHVPIVPETNGS